MGGDHDLMDAVSHHGATASHAGRRPRTAGRLRSVMEARRVRARTTNEWWHYTLEDEPYPDTYFDFPVSAPATALWPRP